MQGLTVRWSLVDTDDDLAQQLTDYVADASWERFTGMDGLRFKSWRMRQGEWFEGSYVFETSKAREEFQTAFAEKANEAPVSLLIGRGPEWIEACRVLAVAEGGSGFKAFDRD
jgi:hypothetical protein